MSNRAFFSFVGLTDPARHHDYNVWHQLDHRPENLALPGVLYGDRWVRTPACERVGATPDPALADVHYVALYLFGEPAAESIRAWQDLAERSFQWGRRPDRDWVRRPLMGFFSHVSTYVSPRLSLSPAALPLRPARGVYVTVARITEPHGAAAHEAFRWHDAVGIPALLRLPGVAGACTFSSDSTTLDHGWEARPGTTTFDADSGAERGQIRVHMLFLDEDPVAVAPALRAHCTAPGEAEELLLAGPLETIAPWNWEWFER
jgi:hypothetical protein